MAKYKLDVTRPTFSLRTMDITSIVDLPERSLDDICGNHILTYCVYTVLMETNVHNNEMSSVTCDEDSVAIRFIDKDTADKIGRKCNKSKVRFGHKKYRVHVKRRDEYLIFTVCPNDDEDDD